jgi:hypothetical protein
MKLKVKDKNHKIYELLKLSIGNNDNYFNYSKNKVETSNQNLGINYYRKYIKTNIGKMIYKTNEKNKKKKYLIEPLYQIMLKRLKS